MSDRTNAGYTIINAVTVGKVKSYSVKGLLQIKKSNMSLGNVITARIITVIILKTNLMR